MVHEFTDAAFQTEVLENPGVIMIELWAEWSGPNRAMAPIVEQLATEFEGKAVIGKLNIDDNPEVPLNYNIRGIPTFLLFKGGESKEKVIGLQSKQYLFDKINALLE
jgi:thioredoxin 1